MHFSFAQLKYLLVKKGKCYRVCTILETETRLMLFIAVAYPGPSSQLRTCVDGVSRSTEAEDELPIIVAAFLEVFHSK